MSSLTKPKIARAVVNKIKTQIPEGGEAALLFSVFEHAVRDVGSNTASRIDKDTAEQYLRGKMEHLSLCGIDVDWARKVIQDSGLLGSR